MVVGTFSTEVDVIVIGAGPGGYVAAIRAAQLGKKVVVVDRREVGGVCLNRGCIPSKALISAAHRYETMKHSDEFGITAGDVKVDFKKVQEWKQSVVNKLTGGVGALLKGNKVEFVAGEAFFNDKNVVTVSNEDNTVRYEFKHCIIATGSRPIELKPFPFGPRILSSDGALALDHIPESMVVIGGGYIGVELGQTFSKFGTKVTILEGADNILPGFEPQLSQLVVKNLKKTGVEIYNKALAQKSEVTDKDVTVTFKVGDEEKSVTAEYVLVTVGRRPNTNDIGLENIGVKMTDRGLIAIDNQCRTSVENIYAIGDIVEGLALAHKASYEGKVAAEVIAGMNSVIDYKCIPAVVFSDPEIASVGLTEKEAKDKGFNVLTGRFSFGANGRSLALGNNDGFAKVVADKDSGLVLGTQIVGPEASNLIAEIGLAIEMGATLEDIALTIHAHPTLGEIVMEAAEGALGHSVHQMNK
ncbi:dihydrolipoyl dehydrogenase [Paenibacillus thermotolerans]|uniref:dihydrolipoyl dehydrogenase n=1 Tax=Paenibacillus thermotolerans TaxID=3027807 RepID=UPI00236811DC|nr:MULTISPECIES: dihydrolipoyl dehydrogenase [unclassified Paenibacillus]